MEQALFGDIDWSRPWLAPYAAHASRLCKASDWRMALNESVTTIDLRNHRNLPIRFVPQAQLPPNTAYEAFISATGCVPTRDNQHDFFNALVWLTFPQIKVQLNALQAAEIERREREGASGATRGRVRDAATIFDENSALLVTHDLELIERLRAHDWEEIFIRQRERFSQDWAVWLFGHALMEKLVNPYKAITAHAWPVVVDQAFFELPMPEKRASLDMAVSKMLKGGLSNAGFTPLPVLGIPGWWPAQDLAFYSDKTVFRPKRFKASP